MKKQARHTKQIDSTAAVLKGLKEKVYYSQNREDIILQSFFVGKKSGFYVDIGAYDPDVDSVTKIFYEKGWSGINVEPLPDRFKLFQKKRPRDTNLNLGVADKRSKLILRSYKNQGLSTFSKEIKKGYLDQSESGVYDFAYSRDGTGEYSDIEVAVDTLRSIFEKQGVDKIDFMKIDVEGFEYEALSGNDWQKYRPAILCIEADNIVKNWRQLLLEHKYKLVFNDGLNDYYVDDAMKEPPEFDYINHVLLGLDGGLRYEHFKILKTLEHSQGELKNEIKRLGAAEFALNRRIVEMDGQINSIRWIFRRFIFLAKKHTIGKLR